MPWNTQEAASDSPPGVNALHYFPPGDFFVREYSDKFEVMEIDRKHGRVLRGMLPTLEEARALAETLTALKGGK